MDLQLTILVVTEDDASRQLESALREAGFTVDSTDAVEAVASFRAGRYNLVLVNAAKTDAGGAEVVRYLRRQSHDVPIIVFTGSDEESEVVAALEAGADDCITSLVRARELVARIRAAIRRAPVAEEGSTVLEVGELTLDPTGFGVTLRGEPVEVTRKEFELLHLLMANAGRILTRPILIDRVWGAEATEGKTLDTHIRRLRLKVEDDPSDPTRIMTVRGVGYRFARPIRS